MRRGIARNTLLLLIILLATAAVLLPTVTRAADWMQGYVDGGICGASAVVASTKVEKACIAEIESPTALNCPRRNIVLEEQAAYVSFEGDREAMRIPEYSVSADVVARVFADETLSCWKKFGSGEVALFPEVPSDVWGSLVGDDSAKTGCHICSEIYFTEQTTMENKYLEALSKNIPGKKETYLAALNNDDAYCQSRFDKAPGCWSTMVAEWDDLPVIDTIDTSKTYAVAMIRRGFEVCEEGKQHELSNFVYVIPHDQLSTVCDMVVT